MMNDPRKCFMLNRYREGSIITCQYVKWQYEGYPIDNRYPEYPYSVIKVLRLYYRQSYQNSFLQSVVIVTQCELDLRQKFNIIV